MPIIGIIASALQKAFNDTFNRTVSGSLGSIWTTLRGVWYANGSAAQSDSTPGTYALAVVPAGQDVKASASVTGGTGVAVWVSNADNWWAAVPYSTTYTYSYSCTQSGYDACLTCSSYTCAGACGNATAPTYTCICGNAVPDSMNCYCGNGHGDTMNCSCGNSYTYSCNPYTCYDTDCYSDTMNCACGNSYTYACNPYSCRTCLTMCGVGTLIHCCQWDDGSDICYETCTSPDTMNCACGNAYCISVNPHTCYQTCTSPDTMNCPCNNAVADTMNCACGNAKADTRNCSCNNGTADTNNCGCCCQGGNYNYTTTCTGTGYNYFLRLITMNGGAVSTAAGDITLSAAAAAIVVATKNNQLTAQAYSDTAMTSPLGSPQTVNPASPTRGQYAGVVKAPTAYGQGSTVDNFSVTAQ